MTNTIHWNKTQIKVGTKNSLLLISQNITVICIYVFAIKKINNKEDPPHPYTFVKIKRSRLCISCIPAKKVDSLLKEQCFTARATSNLKHLRIFLLWAPNKRKERLKNNKHVRCSHKKVFQ